MLTARESTASLPVVLPELELVRRNIIPVLEARNVAVNKDLFLN